MITLSNTYIMKILYLKKYSTAPVPGVYRHMLDSAQEPSYNLSKNLLLLPRILKLIKDMVDDSTPLIRVWCLNI